MPCTGNFNSLLSRETLCLRDVPTPPSHAAPRDLLCPVRCVASAPPWPPKPSRRAPQHRPLAQYAPEVFGRPRSLFQAGRATPPPRRRATRADVAARRCKPVVERTLAGSSRSTPLGTSSLARRWALSFLAAGRFLPSPIWLAHLVPRPCPNGTTNAGRVCAHAQASLSTARDEQDNMRTICLPDALVNTHRHSHHRPWAFPSSPLGASSLARR